MRIGLQLPSRLGGAVPALTQRQLLDLATLADDSPGWDHLWVPDSVLALPFYDSVVSLAACAAVTSRVRLGVACMASLGLREPLVVAQQWANLDALSGGRMTLVACTGEPSGPGQERERAAFRLSRGEKIERMTEAVEFLRAVSSQDPASFSGAGERRALADATGTWNRELARPVTPDQVRELAAVGEPGRCAERLAELAEAGATAVILGLLSADPRRQFDRVTEELLPLVPRTAS